MATEASIVFSELITKIETSKLNYMISKTPFSARISIKSSFIKYNVSPLPSETVVKKETEDFKTCEMKNIVDSQSDLKTKLQNSLKQEKLNVKSLEARIELFREEVLNLKKDRNACKLELNSIK